MATTEAETADVTACQSGLVDVEWATGAVVVVSWVAAVGAG